MQSGATGEIEAGLSRHRLLAEQGAADILQTDAAVCGGVTEWMRIAAMASAFGLGMAPHWFHDLHVHLVAAVPNALFVEYFPDDSVLNFRRLLASSGSLTGTYSYFLTPAWDSTSTTTR